MMPLQRTIPLEEIKRERERFNDLLSGVIDKIIRMDEVHTDYDNDGHYLFLIWCDPEDYQKVAWRIRHNVAYNDHAGWETRVVKTHGEGLIVVETYL